MRAIWLAGIVGCLALEGRIRLAGRVHMGALSSSQQPPPEASSVPFSARAFERARHRTPRQSLPTQSAPRRCFRPYRPGCTPREAAAGACCAAGAPLLARKLVQWRSWVRACNASRRIFVLLRSACVARKSRTPAGFRGFRVAARGKLMRSGNCRVSRSPQPRWLADSSKGAMSPGLSARRRRVAGGPSGNRTG